MSNDALRPDIYSLQQSVVDVLSQVRDLMNYASKKLEAPDSKDKRYAEHAKSIENEITKVKNLELRMAIAAPMKAGKSTIINAIVGQDILPSRNAAMTTLPTEIIFSKDVTEPKLKLRYQLAPESDDFVDIYSVLRRSWGKLQEQINTIGITQASEDIAEYPHLQDLLKDVSKSLDIPFLSEVSGTEAIQKSLTDLNDLVRLCGILVPSDNPLMRLVSVPRIEVPFLDEKSGLKLDSVGKLVIVDTPGPNEAGDLNLANVVKIQLNVSSIILLVLDYTQLNTEAAENVKNDVNEVSKIKCKDSIYILVNKIDLRKSKNDMTEEQVLDFVKNKFDIQGSSDRVFEISASRAAYASNFRSEHRMKPDIDEPQLMESAELLARQAFGDMWEDAFPEASMEGMLKAADRIWSKSGFANFLERAIAVLMAEAAPKALKSSLESASNNLTLFKNYIETEKETSETKVTAIDAIENDLREINERREPLKVEVEDLRKSLEKELEFDLSNMQDQSREQSKKIFSRGEIEFQSASEATRFVETETASVKMIVNNLISVTRDGTGRKVKDLSKRVEELIRTKTKPIIEKAQRRLSKQFNVTLELTDIFDKLYPENVREDVRLDIQAKSRSRKYTAYNTVKEHYWYTLWLWEHEKQVPVSRTERFFIVSVDEVNKTVDESIEAAVKKVKQKVFDYLEKDFQSVIDKYFDELDGFLKGYQESLQKSIDVKKQDPRTRAEYKVALDKISDDSAKLKVAVENQKKYVAKILKSKQ